MLVYIVIAAYNEEKKIRKVLNDLTKRGYTKIVVVDDGSSDTTGAVASKYATVLTHVINRGQGAGLKTGIEYALSKGADIIVTYDADGQFKADEIKAVVEPVENGSVDVSFGSRFLGKAINIPFLKKAVLVLGRLVVLLFYGMYVTDPQCGFRAISRSAAEKIRLTTDRMEHAGEFFLEISRKRLKYREVPVTVVYDNYSIGKGQDWTKSFELGLKMLLKRLR